MNITHEQFETAIAALAEKIADLQSDNRYLRIVNDNLIAENKNLKEQLAKENGND